jgi:S-adenosylmethionine:tRNA ribosyltransferase-isomerase
VDAAAGRVEDRGMAELPAALRPGDLLVVNDAAPLPASLRATAPRGPVEVRLAGPGEGERDWTAVLLGAGSWRERTEDRPPPPEVAAGDELRFAGGLAAAVGRVSALSRRLVELRFDRAGEALWGALYAAGRPVQYSHLAGPLALGHVQTPYASRPWAVQMPSAGRPFTGAVQRALRERGIGLAALTHAAGLSATGDPELDRMLPLPERYEIPGATLARIDAARAAGGRVVAAGSSAARALEACATEHGTPRAGRGVARIRVGEGHRPRVLQGLLTGLHEPGSSHFELLRAFVPPELLGRAVAHAERRGYLGHEFGDVCLALAA